MGAVGVLAAWRRCSALRSSPEPRRPQASLKVLSRSSVAELWSPTPSRSLDRSGVAPGLWILRKLSRPLGTRAAWGERVVRSTLLVK